MVNRFQFSLIAIGFFIAYAAAWLWIFSDPWAHQTNLITPAVLSIFAFGIAQVYGTTGTKRAYWGAFITAGAFAFYAIDASGVGELVEMFIDVELWAFPAWTPMRLLVAVAVAIPTAFGAQQVYMRTHAPTTSHKLEKENN